jgi:pyridoxamine 5'-phosphate oxidase
MNLRSNFVEKNHMHEQDFIHLKDPFALLDRWIEEARTTEPCNAEAAQLATVDSEGMPNIRTVLIRQYDADGLVFYTNLQSVKARELLATGRAALLFYWKSLARQVRLRGTVNVIDNQTADAYFASRPLGSQISAHASRQSRPMGSRESLKKRFRKFKLLYKGVNVPRPPHWSGFLMTPLTIEFWREGPFRMHDRLEFIRDGESWHHRLLYP